MRPCMHQHPDTVGGVVHEHGGLGSALLERGPRAKTLGGRVQVTVYGKTVSLRVLVIDALWYVAAGSEIVRLWVVRGFPGHDKDDVVVSTNPALEPATIIETFSERWALEVAFFHA